MTVLRPENIPRGAAKALSFLGVCYPGSEEAALAYYGVRGPFARKAAAKNRSHILLDQAQRTQLLRGWEARGSPPIAVLPVPWYVRAYRAALSFITFWK